MVRGRCRVSARLSPSVMKAAAQARCAKNSEFCRPATCATASSLSQKRNNYYRLFSYRFEGADSALTGHSLGNLLLTALTDITGGFDDAILAASEVLAI